MTSTKTLEKIKVPMSLNSYEAKIWTALLSRGISSASELADMSGVPRSRCYDVLESLEKKGFVFMKIGKPIKYIAVHPEEVMETLKKHTRIEENSRLALVEELEQSETFGELKTLYKNGVNHFDNDDLSGSITGRANINLFLKEVMAGAKNVTIHTTKKGVPRKLKLAKKSKSKNITMHAPVESIKDKTIKLNKNNGSMRLVKADDTLLFFSTHEDISPENECAVWIKSKFMTDAVSEFLK